MNAAGAEVIEWDGRIRCYLWQAAKQPGRTAFITHPDETLQAGRVAHREGETVMPHLHSPARREVAAVAEVLLVQRGRCEMQLFDERGQPRGTYLLGPGDVVVLLECGHGFRMLEDTVLFEVKQGPYLGPREKRFF